MTKNSKAEKIQITTLAQLIEEREAFEDPKRDLGEMRKRVFDPVVKWLNNTNLKWKTAGAEWKNSRSTGKSKGIALGRVYLQHAPGWLFPVFEFGGDSKLQIWAVASLGSTNSRKEMMDRLQKMFGSDSVSSVGAKSEIRFKIQTPELEEVEFKNEGNQTEVLVDGRPLREWAERPDSEFYKKIKEFRSNCIEFYRRRLFEYAKATGKQIALQAEFAGGKYKFPLEWAAEGRTATWKCDDKASNEYKAIESHVSKSSSKTAKLAKSNQDQVNKARKRFEKLESGNSISAADIHMLSVWSSANVWSVKNFYYGEQPLEFTLDDSKKLVAFLKDKDPNPAIDEEEGAGTLTSTGKKIRGALEISRTVVLEGVPGTGKTYVVKELWKKWERKTERDYESITMHPATSYEDFVEGLRPARARAEDWAWEVGKACKLLDADGEKMPEEKMRRYFHVRQDSDSTGSNAEVGGDSGGSSVMEQKNSASVGFTMADGFFLRACARAANAPKRDHLVLLDELNRCNVPRVMGDLLTTVEASKRASWNATKEAWDLSNCQVVTLPASGRKFFVPDNLYIIATMNTTDRSVAPLDAALRRRFAFVRMKPDFKELQKEDNPEYVRESAEVMSAINGSLIEANLGRDALLGHSYLYDMRTLLGQVEKPGSDREQRDVVLHVWNHQILPQLAEVLVANRGQRKFEDMADRFGTSQHAKLLRFEPWEEGVIDGRYRCSLASPEVQSTAAESASDGSKAPSSGDTSGSDAGGADVTQSTATLAGEGS